MNSINEYRYEDLRIGMKESFQIQISDEMENSFRAITGDINPLHNDDNYAVEIGNGKFKNHVTFGLLTASFYSTIVGVYLPGKYSLIHSFDNISFIHPVYAGDDLIVSAELTGKEDALNIVILKLKITKVGGQVVSRGRVKVCVLR